MNKFEWRVIAGSYQNDWQLADTEQDAHEAARAYIDAHFNGGQLVGFAVKCSRDIVLHDSEHDAILAAVIDSAEELPDRGTAISDALRNADFALALRHLANTCIAAADATQVSESYFHHVARKLGPTEAPGKPETNTSAIDAAMALEASRGEE